MGILTSARRAFALGFMRLFEFEARRAYECMVADKLLVVAPQIGYQTPVLGLHRVNFRCAESPWTGTCCCGRARPCLRSGPAVAVVA